MKPAIEVHNLSKKYYLKKNIEKGSCGISHFARAFFHSDSNIFWALRHISFSINAGEVVGLVGKNGCGKSTLLKILSRITLPTEGHAIIRGRAAALLGIGTGFHSDLSGKENIFVNGGILGMRPREIKKRLDEIIDFSEVRDFIDMPVKYFSSGMYTKLAFSIAAHLDQPILFIDEILAFSDSLFRDKCLKKMVELSRGGKSILLVHHDENIIRALCNRCIYLDKGFLVSFGKTAEILSLYDKNNLESVGLNLSK